MLATWSHWKYHSTLPPECFYTIVDTEYTDKQEIHNVSSRFSPGFVCGCSETFGMSLGIRPQKDRKIPEWCFYELTQEWFEHGWWQEPSFLRWRQEAFARQCLVLFLLLYEICAHVLNRLLACSCTLQIWPSYEAV